MSQFADPVARAAFLESAFGRASTAIAATDLDGRLLACNPAYSAIVGIEIEDLIGMDAADLIHPDDKGEGSDGAPIRLLRHDGTTAWVRRDVVLVEDVPGEPYVLMTMSDATREVEAEAHRARTEAWFLALGKHQSDSVTVVDFDGVLQYISPNCERLLGFTVDEMLGSGAADNIHPDDVEALVAGLGTQLSDERVALTFEYRARRRDGSWLWLEATARRLPREFGIKGVIINARDITERKRATAAAQETETRFRTAFASSPLGIGFANLDGRVTWVNHALANTAGIPEARLLEMTFQDFSSAEELVHEIGETRRLLRGEIESFCVEKRYEHPDGRTVWGNLHVSLVRGADGAPAQLLGQLEDVTERKQLEMSLVHDAIHDPLTGLLNRAGLRKQVDLAWSVRSRTAPLAILFGDLDGFKLVNDTLGHDAGDEVLVLVAQRIRAAVRAGDIVTRWGGDEFVILCPTVADAEDAASIADRVRAALERPFRIGAGRAEIAISIGVALDAGHPLPSLLLKDADEAAYRGKVAGRNRVVVAAPTS